MLVMRASELKPSTKRATARWIRTVFNNADFARRNIIAAKIENVIDPVVTEELRSENGESFSRPAQTVKE